MGVVVGSTVAITGSVVVVDDAAMTIVDVDSSTGAGVVVDATTRIKVDVSMAVVTVDSWTVVVGSITLVVVGGVDRTVTLTVISSLGS